MRTITTSGIGIVLTGLALLVGTYSSHAFSSWGEKALQRQHEQQGKRLELVQYYDDEDEDPLVYDDSPGLREEDPRAYDDSPELYEKKPLQDEDPCDREPTKARKIKCLEGLLAPKTFNLEGEKTRYLLEPDL